MSHHLINGSNPTQWRCVWLRKNTTLFIVRASAHILGSSTTTFGLSHAIADARKMHVVIA